MVTVLASSPGWRYVTPPTRSRKRRRSVLAAAKDSVVYPSSIGSSAGHSMSIWNQWSITESVRTPIASAVCRQAT